MLSQAPMGRTEPHLQLLWSKTYNFQSYHKTFNGKEGFVNQVSLMKTTKIYIESMSKTVSWIWDAMANIWYHSSSRPLVFQSDLDHDSASS
jgi:hypothetical protein